MLGRGEVTHSHKGNTRPPSPLLPKAKYWVRGGVGEAVFTLTKTLQRKGVCTKGTTNLVGFKISELGINEQQGP